MKKFIILISLVTFFSCGSYNVIEEKGKLELGMTPEQVVNAWGKPTTIVEYETALNGHVTAYMYIQVMKSTSQVVHFKDGVVVNFMYEKNSKENNWR
ncbi:hypothetical protein LS482_07540 [Sinomicrobium kalidii]|uniref:hypothetical protein n=1 Tax=Sinomicrobium kalidii TaxID=2900738 RepID=UPI001E4D15AD|nr:hypothetical protein [Sinomicrobium kalidii]UGU17721.1 hypothetical protein LS482_07540 [Sinomicrobium kalidii]